MPRLSPILFKGNGRRPQIRLDNFPIFENPVLRLRDRTEWGADKSRDKRCQEEVMKLLNCFKLNSFEESACAKELQGLGTCFKRFQLEDAEKKKNKPLPNHIPAGTKAHELTKDEKCTLLARYPLNIGKTKSDIRKLVKNEKKKVNS